MRNERVKKLGLTFALVVVGFVVLFAFPAEADRSHVEFETSLTVPAGTYQYKPTSVYVPAAPESVSYVASFNVPSGEIVRFQVLDVARFELLQEGIFEPDWVVGNEGSYGIGISSQFSKTETLYLVVLNDASSSSQDVKAWLSRTWHESSKLGLASGSALISLGMAIIPLSLFGKSRLNLKYSALLFAMAFLSVFNFAWAPYWSTPPNPINNLAMAVPGVFFFEAFPLIVLLYLLEKNRGFDFFKNWKMKEKLRISGFLVMLGYTIPIVFMLLNMVNIFLPWNTHPNYVTVWSASIGLLLMLMGSTIFVGLAATHHRRTTLQVISNIPAKTEDSSLA